LTETRTLKNLVGSAENVLPSSELYMFVGSVYSAVVISGLASFYQSFLKYIFLLIVLSGVELRAFLLSEVSLASCLLAV
jgi:hypothetical protein